MLTRIFGLSAIVALGIGLAAATNAEPNDAPDRIKTATPIYHVIVLIGENPSFDNVFATFRSKRGHSVSNLLFKRIIKPNGAPGPNAAEAAQFVVNNPLPSMYFMGTGFTKTAYSPFLPTPELGHAPNHPTSLAQLLANPAAAQPPFDNTISDAQLAAIESALESFDLFLLRTGATGAAGMMGPDPPIRFLHRRYGPSVLSNVAAVRLQCEERRAW